MRIPSDLTQNPVRNMWRRNGKKMLTKEIRYVCEIFQPEDSDAPSMPSTCFNLMLYKIVRTNVNNLKSREGFLHHSENQVRSQLRRVIEKVSQTTTS